MNWLKRLSLPFACSLLALCTIEAVDPPFLDDRDQSEVVSKWHRLTGRRGQKGHSGETGKHGPKGTRGTKGLRGPRGNTGPQGNTGSAGPTGPTGPQGPSGATGATGSVTGPTGSTGSAGPIGSGGANLIFAYGSATLYGGTGSQITSVPLFLPLSNTGEPLNNMTFNPSTTPPAYAFTIAVAGTYAIDYFVQVSMKEIDSTTLAPPPLVIGVAINGAPDVEDELIPISIFGAPLSPAFNYTSVSSGTKHIVRTLNVGDTLQLQIASPLPTHANAFLDAYAPTIPPKVNASLAIHRID